VASDDHLAHDGVVARAMVAQGGDRRLRHPAKPEPAKRERRAVADVGDRLCCACDHLAQVRKLEAETRPPAR
jgi:hypothetical protein